MSANSKIEWTDHTFNAWWGCAKVSPGCDNCYAERDAGRYFPGHTYWGVHADRREFSDRHWAEPRKWNAQAAKAGKRVRVFCSSMADVFDKNSPTGARERLWSLIKETPNLDWLILTKRISNAAQMLPADWDGGYQNVWLGISVVNQEEADRDIPKLLATHASVRWLSMEPLLGPVDISRYLDPGIDWVVVGGESGSAARPMHPAWAESIRDQCADGFAEFLFKQWGEWHPYVGVPTDDALKHEPHKYRVVSSTGDESAMTSIADSSSIWMRKVGKKVAGRLLAGVEYNGYPRTYLGTTEPKGAPCHVS